MDPALTILIMMESVKSVGQIEIRIMMESVKSVGQIELRKRIKGQGAGRGRLYRLCLKNWLPESLYM